MQAAMDSMALRGVDGASGRAQVPPLLQPLRQAAALQPGGLALRCGAQSLDYADLNDSVERIAAGLHALGVRTGDIVALGAQREADTVMLMLGVLRAGGVCMPLDMTLPAPRLRGMLDDARPRLLVAPECARAPWPRYVPRCERGELEAQGVSAPPAPAGAAEACYLLFTSGSSGRPKGVLMRSASIAALIGWHAQHPRLGLSARTLQFAPFGFDVAFQEILSTFATAGTLVVADHEARRDPWKLLELLHGERIERAFLPVAALHALAEAVAAGGRRPVALRDVITAGEQLRITPAVRALFASLPDCVLHNHYGPTETHVVTAHELHGDPQGWPELPPIGRPLPHARTRVADASLAAVPRGEEGELLLGGECLAVGYLHRDRLTAERFIHLDGARWYRTGDRVRERADGVLEYLGRLDDQIKLDGYRIEPAEVESVLVRHAAVAQAAVVLSDGAQGRRLVAHVVARPGSGDEAALRAQWREHCRAQLPAWMVPQDYIVHAALPHTASGKLDRRALARESEQAPIAWPEGASLREQLRALWAQLLERPDLAADANLFDEGARSLTVVRALTELRRRGFDTITAAHLYEHPSAASQAAWLEAAPGAVAEQAARLREAQATGTVQRAALAKFAARRINREG
ncbi:MAG TPA: non-ribosomal peptide synthetase [Rhodanobacteraceae bacterium]